jgi:hypothetical protein
MPLANYFIGVGTDPKKVSVRLSLAVIRRLKHEMADTGISFQELVQRRLDFSYDRDDRHLSFIPDQTPRKVRK